MIQALDLVTRSLRAIGACAAGEPPDQEDANDAFETLNELLETWSNSTLMVPYVTEIIHTLQTNLANYTIGQGGTVGGAFTGALSLTTLTVSVIPSGNIALGQYITGAGVTVGTQIVAFQTGAGGIGTYSVNINYAVPIAAEAMQTYYQRPLRINSAFVRSATLDYPVAVLNVETWELIGLKSQGGPWPRALYYQPSHPVGNITYWPVPGSGEMHLFAETVLQAFTTLSDVVTLPQGYAQAIRWNLAEQLLPEYGKAGDSGLVQLVLKNAADSRAWVKRTNANPPYVASFDPALLTHSGRAPSNWILGGGFIP
jgi:hypothetical protein